MAYIISASLSAIAIVLSLSAIVVVLRKQVTVNIVNIDGQEIDLKWEGKVLRNVLYLHTNGGESTIISDSLLPLHGKTVTVIVLPKTM